MRLMLISTGKLVKKRKIKEETKTHTTKKRKNLRYTAFGKEN